jgi:hypothetical protein
MSQENVEIARRSFEAFNRTFNEGTPDLYEMLDPEVEWVPMSALLEGTAYHGHDGRTRLRAARRTSPPCVLGVRRGRSVPRPASTSHRSCGRRGLRGRVIAGRGQPGFGRERTSRRRRSRSMWSHLSPSTHSPAAPVSLPDSSRAGAISFSAARQPPQSTLAGGAPRD